MCPGGARSRRCEIPTKPDAAAAVPAGLVGDGSPGESPGGATDDVTGLLGHGPVDIWAQQPLQPAPASSSQQLVALMLNGATRFSRRGARGLGRCREPRREPRRCDGRCGRASRARTRRHLGTTAAPASSSQQLVALMLNGATRFISPRPRRSPKPITTKSM